MRHGRRPVRFGRAGWPRPTRRTGPADHRRPAGDGFDTADSPARAWLAVWISDNVPDVSGVAGRAAVDRSAQDETAPDSRRDHHPEHGGGPLPRSAAMLADRRADRVVSQRGRRADQPGETLAERKNPPGGDVDP